MHFCIILTLFERGKAFKCWQVGQKKEWRREHFFRQNFAGQACNM